MSNVKLFHAPKTRSTGALCLLEELGVPYDIHVLNMKTGEHKQPAYLAVNPLGKVPALVHDGQLVTEQAAVYMYLADLYPEKGVAPRIGDPLRGPYLRWMLFYGSAFEPAVVDKAQKRDPAPPGMSPYGTYDETLAVITDQLAKGPYLLGDKFYACDMLWGMALGWTTKFGIVEATPVIRAYIDRVVSRPSVQRVNAMDVDWSAKQVPPA